MKGWLFYATAARSMQIHHRENMMNIEYIIRISNFLYFEVRKVKGGIRNFTPFFGFTF